MTNLLEDLYRAAAYAAEQAEMANITPEELWVGPSYTSLLLAEQQWMIETGRLPIGTDPTKLDTVRIMGLRVRGMVEEGIRVGSSYGSDKTCI